jgi:hypothetical protein
MARWIVDGFCEWLMLEPIPDMPMVETANGASLAAIAHSLNYRKSVITIAAAFRPPISSTSMAAGQWIEHCEVLGA